MDVFQLAASRQPGTPTKEYRLGQSLAMLHKQPPKKYWRVFLIGLGAYILARQVLYSTAATNTVPLVMTLAALLVPVTFVMFCWEQGALTEVPFTLLRSWRSLGTASGRPSSAPPFGASVAWDPLRSQVASCWPLSSRLCYMLYGMSQLHTHLFCT
jgi:hypothetical protein